jgi:hypothetical protein
MLSLGAGRLVGVDPDQQRALGLSGNLQAGENA